MEKLLKFAIGLIFIIISVALFRVLYMLEIFNLTGNVFDYTFTIVGAIIGLILHFLFSSIVAKKIVKNVYDAEDKLVKMTLKELLTCVFGVFVGLVIANLIGMALSGFGAIGTGITIVLNIVLGFLGYSVARRKKDELKFDWIKNIFVKNSSKNTVPLQEVQGRPKILDTSVIIDGRILDLLQTGFIEGKIIIPNFVLEELRHIADSADSLKRNRGRRGLDILNEIQKQLSVPVETVDFNIKEQLEVDSKLLKMAEKMDAFVVTNDFNLNKVAEFQGVKVLNINELANAIKPIVLPGEEMQVTIIKSGKENGQGIAYLNDGTMIVVEGGNKFIGETLSVTVTSVLQTAAGRMIFTKINDR